MNLDSFPVDTDEYVHQELPRLLVKLSAQINW